MQRFKGIAYIVLLAVVLPWAVWRLSVGRTVSLLGSLHAERREMAGLTQDGPAEPYADSALGPELLLNGAFLDELIRSVGGEAVSVERYAPYAAGVRGGLAVSCAEVVLRGGYAALVRLTDAAERAAPGLNVVSACFRSRTVRRTGRIELTLTLVVRQIYDV